MVLQKSSDQADHWRDLGKVYPSEIHVTRFSPHARRIFGDLVRIEVGELYFRYFNESNATECIQSRIEIVFGPTSRAI